ncbi:MAG: DUF2953 domain-containing protein [Clostridia bacterium]|nr:DUF2953 domain-containing protein [Clostridia bacterium]
MAFIIGGILILLFVCLLLTPATIEMRVIHASGTHEVALYAGIGALRIRLGANKKKEKQRTVSAEEHEEKQKEKPSIDTVKTAIEKGISIVRYLQKKFTVKLFSIDLRMGLGDAADTGIAVGAAYTALYTLLGEMDRYFILKKQRVSVQPDFSGLAFDIDFKGIFQLRLLYCLGLLIKIRKEDVK